MFQFGRNTGAKNWDILGSGCGSVGRAVASVRGSNPVIGKNLFIYVEHLFPVNCVLERRK